MRGPLLLVVMLLAMGVLAAPATKNPDEQQPLDWQDPLTGMFFRAIPKGCFKMGASTPQVPQPEVFWNRVAYTKTASEDEKPLHEVCVDAFWLGKYEVSMGEWQRVMSGTPMNKNASPVAGITWNQAQEFVHRITEMSRGQFHFRLPTEAEWEYACRGGAAKDVDPLANGAEGSAWYQFSRTTPQPVGQLQANSFGLHDMLGNVWEWVADRYLADGYARHTLYNPLIAPKKNVAAQQQVLRGGSFRTESVQVRCAMRGHHERDVVLDSIGLRLVRER